MYIAIIVILVIIILVQALVILVQLKNMSHSHASLHKKLNRQEFLLLLEQFPKKPIEVGSWTPLVQITPDHLECYLERAGEKIKVVCPKKPELNTEGYSTAGAVEAFLRRVNEKAHGLR